MSDVMSADFWIVKRALEMLPTECRYHGDDFGKLGHLSASEGGEPRCESCRPAWRRMCGLAALERVRDRVDPPLG
jgi:hypothetical protein